MVAEGAAPAELLSSVAQEVARILDVSAVSIVRFESDTWSVSVEPTGELDCSGAPLDASNIAVRAGRLLSAHHGVGRAAAIRIAKGIPVAGGLAGGSADAAASLVALDRLWDLNTSDEDLLRLAAELGSDVPFALLGGTARGTGRGEVVEQIDDPGTWWWVVVPNATDRAPKVIVPDKYGKPRQKQLGYKPSSTHHPR